MKQTIISGCSFFVGAFIMFLCMPPDPVANLTLITSKGIIRVPMQKEVFTNFVSNTTNQLQILSVVVENLNAKKEQTAP